MTQMQAIKDHLKTKRKITSMEAIKFYGCTRLSDKIFRLRKAGWKIETQNTIGRTRYGTFTVYATYILESAPDEV